MEQLLKTPRDRAQMRMWIKALRSGEYKQGKNRLQDADRFCCLGVACKVLIPSSDQRIGPSGGLIGLMPIAQSNSPYWLKGVDTDFMERTGKFLATLNDEGLMVDGVQEKTDFNEIADLLEAVYVLKVLE